MRPWWLSIRDGRRVRRVLLAVFWLIFGFEMCEHISRCPNDLWIGLLERGQGFDSVIEKLVKCDQPRIIFVEGIVVCDGYGMIQLLVVIELLKLDDVLVCVSGGGRKLTLDFKHRFD